MKTEIQDILNNKRKKNYIEEIIRKLKSINAQNPIFSLLARSKAGIGKKAAHLGLLLLNELPEFANKSQGYYYRFRLEQGSARFDALKELAKKGAFWDADHYPLLEMFFGATKAPLVKEAWDMVPSLMYQTGYDRRSFRGPEFYDMNFTRQLNFITELLHQYQYDFSINEYAVYSNYTNASHFSFVFASALNQKDKSFKQLLLDIVYGRHEEAGPSRDIIKGMLLADDEECWDAVGKLLLSAQRQEGLRQIILETLDECSVGAFISMIKLILDHKLTRFSSVVRAIDTWTGLGWEGEKESTVKRFLELGYLYLTQPEKVNEAISSQDNAEVYMALWATGVHNVSACNPLLDRLINCESVEKISLALYFTEQIGINTLSLKAGKNMLSHSDLIIKGQAICLINRPNCLSILRGTERAEIFEQLKADLDLFKAKKVIEENRVFSWLKFKVDKNDFFGLMIQMPDLSHEGGINLILPYFEEMAVQDRELLTRKILPESCCYTYKQVSKIVSVNKNHRDFAFRVVKDKSVFIKSAAIRTLGHSHLEEEELDVFIELLKRKATDFRKAVIQLIEKQAVDKIKWAAEKLLYSSTEEQKLGGLDLLLWLKTNSKEDKSWVTKQVEKFQEQQKLTAKQEVVLKGLTNKSLERAAYSRENGFGLYEPDSVSKVVKPRSTYSHKLKEERNVHPTGLSCAPQKVNEALEKLGSIFLENRDYEYSYENWDGGQTTVLLGNTFTSMKRDMKDMSPEMQFENYPLNELWDRWFKASSLTPKDLYLILLGKDVGKKIIEVDTLHTLYRNMLSSFFIPELPKITENQWQNPIPDIIRALSIRYPYQDNLDYLLAWVEEAFTSIPEKVCNCVYTQKSKYNYIYKTTWHKIPVILKMWKELSVREGLMDEEQFCIYWNLAYWQYCTIPDSYEEKFNYIPSVYAFLRAFESDIINKDTLYFRMLQPDALHDLTMPKSKSKKQDLPNNLVNDFVFLSDVLDNCVSRVLELELVRGEDATPVTHLAQSIERIEGVKYFVQILNALGKDNLHRGYSYYARNRLFNKNEVLSKLLKNCYSEISCTQNDFNELIITARITEKRLVEAAVYAQQWLPYVSVFLGWKNMESAVWWLHAHTSELRNAQTETEIAKYSAVEMTAFRDGAVDIDWFKDFYKSLGKEKWKKLYNSAKYISDGTGHTRGKLYADVITGNTRITEVTERITSKRNQDYLRVYGVIPLNKKNPEGDVLRRYRFLQNFKKESKQFGAQRQASENTAVRIALENLARTAGYPDPIRLQWAMETKEANEILENAKELSIDDLIIRLEVDENGWSSLVVIKNDKKLKSLPAKYKKNKEVEKLKEFNKVLRDQYRRTRVSLEKAMVNGDDFKISEIHVLMSHPVVAPMLSKLVMFSSGNIGFWSDGKLVSPDNKQYEAGEQIRIAHCVDLYDSGFWSDFQHFCFEQKLKQPFKQIFRELYVPTQDELKEKTLSRRYAGYQIQPNKTLALLKSQGWTVDYEQGLQKVHHKYNVISQMYALADWFSPADVEAPAIETVTFFDRKKGSVMEIQKVESRIFSETMRDLDLVVSVAHVGGVDPEASHSTVEMRTVIIKETVQLFKLKNVSLSDHHALIKGKHGDYSVHLGSGICHKVAGAALSVIPVHSQHRGRMFLPFVDDDPKTAEIMSKVLLLAKDHEIKDPTILTQI